MVEPDLREKYGDTAFEAGLALQPTTFERRLAQRDRLDQHFARLWLDFAVAGMSRRTVLDARTRLLVQIGQFAMTRSSSPLEDGIRAAIAAGVKAREILEVILQCVIYGGHIVVDPAIDIFERIAAELGLLAGINSSQLPIDGNDTARSLAEEQAQWDPEDADSPRREDLMDRHGWLAVGRGLLLRPKHHLSTLAWQDALDQEWAGLWVKFVYQGMYSRFMLDDKTRLLCMVGNCVAVNEAVQGRAHMKGAMRAGASPREVMEVIIQSTVNFGMPSAIASLKAFVKIMKDAGRLDEIGNPPERD
jgi:alkylhydroperoxidase/carboxymuconolactone decarboxylase family protein YurZ